MILKLFLPRKNLMARSVNPFYNRKSMDLTQLGSKRVLFVTGKGGVGKTFVSFALAQRFARQGRKSLVVQIGASSTLPRPYQKVSLGYNAQPLERNIYGARWDGPHCLKEYLLSLIPVSQLYRLFFENRVMRSLIDVAPGLLEVAILGKITHSAQRPIDSEEYDLIIVDGFATGHFISLLRAPIGLSEAIQGGPVAVRSRQIVETLRAPEICEYVVVALPEELSLVETREFCLTLKKELEVCPKIICNRSIVPPASVEELKKILAHISEKSVLSQFVIDLLFRLDIEKKAILELGQTGQDVFCFPEVLNPSDSGV